MPEADCDRHQTVRPPAVSVVVRRRRALSIFLDRVWAWWSVCTAAPWPGVAVADLRCTVSARSESDWTYACVRRNKEDVWLGREAEAPPPGQWTALVRPSAAARARAHACRLLPHALLPAAAGCNRTTARARVHHRCLNRVRMCRPQVAARAVNTAWSASTERAGPQHGRRRSPLRAGHIADAQPAGRPAA